MGGAWALGEALVLVVIILCFLLLVFSSDGVILKPLKSPNPPEVFPFSISLQTISPDFVNLVGPTFIFTLSNVC